MKVQRNVIMAGVICLACGWWLASSPLSPVNPRPQRPVLSFLAKVAKTFMWVMLAAEPAPDTHHLSHASLDADGHPVVSHGSGW